MNQSDIDHMIDLVWGDFDDFEEGGEEYVCWVIANDISDIAEGNYERHQAVKEFCDIIINARRMLALEYGVDPDEMLIKRLKEHDAKGPESVVEQYTKRYRLASEWDNFDPISDGVGISTLEDFTSDSDD